MKKLFDPKGKNRIEYSDIVRVLDDISLVEKIYLNDNDVDEDLNLRE